jgi:2-keto-4-pentenoate hydratase/2-oxohepta-3-ene-1,7-dioic acid hydratase in catechol pathway
MSMPAPRPFALVTAQAPGEAGPYAGILVEERVVDIRPDFGDAASVRALIDQWDQSLPFLQEIADRVRELDGRPLDELRLLAPVQSPGQIFQAGANYRQHVLDLMAGAHLRGDTSDGLSSGDRDTAREELDRRLATGRPFVFLGLAHAMVGPYDDVVLPYDSAQHDWELELAVVIGRSGRRVPASEAVDLVAGYMMCNDVTSRDALARTDTRGLGLDWLAGKNSPTFLPAGPWLVPASHVADPMRLDITLRVNGEVMQSESTADMVFGLAELIAYISEVAEVRPGDIVLTGSPAGNGASRGVFLKPNDLMTGEITGLGKQINRCVAEPRASAAPPTDSGFAGATGALS